ncbi:membrane protein [Burkholderiaceae bacterium 16]|nr:membrane protein [Burkholderiaceae bacterium 16]
MSEAMDYLVGALLIGAGATAVMDLWAVARKRILGIPPLDYGLVGRWLVHLTRGRFRHTPIAASPPVWGERPIGWIAHYLTGIAFAAMLLALWGLDWARHPTPGPALIVGIGSVAAPFLVMQPGMGAGIAASRTPRPAAARLHSLVTHGIFGLGLYGAGWVMRLFGTFQ